MREKNAYPKQGDKVYGPEERARLAEWRDLEPETVLTRGNSRQRRRRLARARILVSTWGGPVVDEEFLEAAPERRRPDSKIFSPPARSFPSMRPCCPPPAT